MSKILLTATIMLTSLNLYCNSEMQEKLIQAVENYEVDLVKTLMNNSKTTENDINEVDLYGSTLNYQAYTGKQQSSK